nr:MAG: hypothetical protein [Trichoderma harzianum mononegavirus 2]
MDLSERERFQAETADFLTQFDSIFDEHISLRQRVTQVAVMYLKQNNIMNSTITTEAEDRLPERSEAAVREMSPTDQIELITRSYEVLAGNNTKLASSFAASRSADARDAELTAQIARFQEKINKLRVPNRSFRSQGSANLSSTGVSGQFRTLFSSKGNDKDVSALSSNPKVTDSQAAQVKKETPETKSSK